MTDSLFYHCKARRTFGNVFVLSFYSRGNFRNLRCFLWNNEHRDVCIRRFGHYVCRDTLFGQLVDSLGSSGVLYPVDVKYDRVATFEQRNTHVVFG